MSPAHAIHANPRRSNRAIVDRPLVISLAMLSAVLALPLFFFSADNDCFRLFEQMSRQQSKAQKHDIGIILLHRDTHTPLLAFTQRAAFLTRCLDNALHPFEG